MKRFIFTSVSALTLLVAIVPSVFAQTSASAAFTTAQSTRSIPGITPNDLVSQAYQGFFITQGIPSAGALLGDYQFGQLTARDLVLAGIQTDRLSSDRLNDRAYLRAVDAALSSLANHN